jgi:hypothetical protein
MGLRRYRDVVQGEIAFHDGQVHGLASAARNRVTCVAARSALSRAVVTASIHAGLASPLVLATRSVLWEVATVLASVMLAGCATVQATGDPSAPVPGQPVPASAIDRLTAMANGYARVNGGGTAEWASAVVTSWEKALTSAYGDYGDTVPGDDPETIVYLVTMKGHFISRRAAPRAQNPTGSYLSFVVNAEDFRPRVFGITSNPPPVDPASFGPLTYLKVGAGR